MSPGATNLVMTTGAAPDATSRESMWWISDQGVRYGISLDDETLRALGISPPMARPGAVAVDPGVRPRARAQPHRRDDAARHPGGSRGSGPAHPAAETAMNSMIARRQRIHRRRPWTRSQDWRRDRTRRLPAGTSVTARRSPARSPPSRPPRRRRPPSPAGQDDSSSAQRGRRRAAADRSRRRRPPRGRRRRPPAARRTGAADQAPTIAAPRWPADANRVHTGPQRIPPGGFRQGPPPAARPNRATGPWQAAGPLHSQAGGRPRESAPTDSTRVMPPTTGRPGWQQEPPRERSPRPAGQDWSSQPSSSPNWAVAPAARATGGRLLLRRQHPHQ